MERRVGKVYLLNWEICTFGISRLYTLQSCIHIICWCICDLHIDLICLYISKFVLEFTTSVLLRIYIVRYLSLIWMFYKVVAQKFKVCDWSIPVCMNIYWLNIHRCIYHSDYGYRSPNLYIHVWNTTCPIFQLLDICTYPCIACILIPPSKHLGISDPTNILLSTCKKPK